jgi:ligand-binding sensor domain-containing protein
MPPSARTLALGTLALTTLVTGHPATTHQTDGCSVRVWQPEDGLPENLVPSATQTQDGYLWLAR